ncbi:MAG: CBS domain-containing protein [Planctomycetota bacterium]
MSDARARLREISDHLKKGEAPGSLTLREFLSWFGAQRRGYWIVREIRSVLEAAGLVTKPDFEAAYIDSAIAFALAPVAGAAAVQAPETPAPAPLDPTYRIGKLASANRKPVSVRPDDSVEKAVTLMLQNDFSQLPVTTSERDVKGVVSWTSIGSRFALGRGGDRVRLCMDPHVEISSEKSLFEAIGTIVSNQYVLIRNSENVIAGIVTTSDLSLQFQQLGEPFLLLGEIENYVRRMIQDKYPVDELREAQDPSDTSRTVNRVSDLTFGEYRRLLEKPDRWTKLNLAIDRGEFIGKLDQVRNIRNDVMHFDPDGIPESDLKVLRDFARFLQDLRALGAI